MKETRKVAKTVIKVGKGRTMELEADVLELGGRDLIVGMAWLIKGEAVIDCKQFTITFPDEEQWNCEPVPLPTVEDGTWEDALNENNSSSSISTSSLYSPN